MTGKISKAQLIELKALASFGENGTSWPTADAKKFAKTNTVELGPDNSETGETPIRISEDGKKYLESLETGVDTGSGSNDNGNHTGNVAEQPKSQGASKSMFKIESNIAVPKASKRTRASAYPFDELEVGQSFFVPATAERPDPAKTMGSTVNGANARFSEEIPGETRTNRKGNVVPATRQLREFIVRPVTEDVDGVEVKGARVWRIEVTGEQTAE